MCQTGESYFYERDSILNSFLSDRPNILDENVENTCFYVIIHQFNSSPKSLFLTPKTGANTAAEK